MLKRLPSQLGVVAVGALLQLAACAQAPVIRSVRTAESALIAQSHTVVFVHGMFMTPLCWEKWEAYFQAKGYQTLAPAWPLHDQPVPALRSAHPSSQLGELTLEQVLAHYRTVIAGLPEKPILIGHSMGGLIVQLLLAEGLGAAGIAIDSAPPEGVISLKYSFLKSNWPAISPSAKLAEPIPMTQAAFNYAFANCLPEDQQQATFQRYAVPESRRVGKGPTTKTAKVDYLRARPPLLMIAGSEDHIIPASLNRDNLAKYKKNPSITDFREFPGRCHVIIGQPGWEEVADYTLDWISKNSAAK
jgi:pimeloyl-ACP methyl ester carboxylesterase